MSRDRSRRGLLATAVVVAGLASAPSAQAVNLDAVTTPFMNSATIEISGWQPGEQNDIVMTPTGAVRDADAFDTFPYAPLSVFVTDKTTPLGEATYGCVKVSAHSARCTASN